MTAFSRISLSRFRVVLVVATIALGGALASLAPADTVPPTPTIALQAAVHFLTPAGEDLVVAPGTYEVDAAKEGLRLKPTGGKEAEAVLVQAQALPHGESLTAPKVDVRPAGEDQYRVALLLPDGTGLEAVGSYSGVRTRGVESTYKTAYGTGALASNTTGDANTAMGVRALALNTTASWNAAMGSYALELNTIGRANTAMGSDALRSNTTGSENTAVGQSALRWNTTGGANTAMGFYALFKNSGVSNTAVGAGALSQNTVGRLNVAMGHNALQYNTTGINNTALGARALQANTTGISNTALGYLTLVYNTAGVNNTATGVGALNFNTIGGHNTATGDSALSANSTGNANTALGYQALYHNTSGSGNTAIGLGAGLLQTVGNNNMYLSHPGVDGESETIRIGTPGFQARAFLTGVAGVPVSGSVVQVDANGQLGIKPSSRRYKEAIENMGTASQGLLHLRPVTFRYTPEVATGERRREYGLIAEEVAEVYPELVGHDADGQIVTVQYHELIPMLLNELQQQHRQLEALTARIAELEAK